MSSSIISSTKSKGNAVLSQERNTSAPPIVVFTLTGDASRANSGDISNHDYEEQINGVKSNKTNSMSGNIQNTQADSGSSNNTSFNSITSIEDTIILPKTTMLQSTVSKEQFNQLSPDKKTDELFSLVQGLLPLTHQITTIQTTLDLSLIHI